MEREAAIAAVLGEVRERWGAHSLTRGYLGDRGARGSGIAVSHAARFRSPPLALPPWWPGAEGYVRPSVVELGGPLSCGKLGLALLWLAAAWRGGLITVVDLTGTFYPPSAAASGLALDRLVVVRPPDRRGAAEAVSLLLGSGGFDAVLWPLAWRARPSGLDAARLAALAGRAGTTLLALVTDGQRVARSEDGARLFPSADVRLRVTAHEWLWRDGELAGVRPRVRTERLRGAPAGQEWEFCLEWHRPSEEREGGATREAADDRAHAGQADDGVWRPAGHTDDLRAGLGARGRGAACPEADHLCLAAAFPLGSGAARAPGPAGAVDRGVRPDPAAAPAARTA